MTQKTIEYVQPKPREWQSGDGTTIAFITVNFSDGSEGSIATIPSKVEEIMGILEGLKGAQHDYDLEAKAEYNGIQQWKVKGYPGKPAGGGGGGGRGGGGMSHSQAGLMAAASYLGPIAASSKMSMEIDIAEAAEAIIDLGERLTEHLFARKPPEQAAAPTSQAPKDAITLTQMKALKEIIERNGWDETEVKQRLDGSALAELSSADAGALIEAWQ